MRALPVTVVSGFPEAAAERVVRRVAADGVRVAAVVPSKRTRRSESGVAIVATTPRLVRQGKGCACCTVRGDLAPKLRKLAEQGTDHVLVLARRQDDLAVLAKTFTVPDASGAVLQSHARLASHVLAMDASMLEGLPVRALFERIELADVVLISGEMDAVAHAVAVVQALAPSAAVHVAGDGPIDLETLRASAPFDLGAARDRAAGCDLLDGREPAPTNPRVARFAFHTHLPFHPGRLHEMLGREWPGILRAQGRFWVASRPGHVGVLDVAGPLRETRSGGVWWAAVPEARWPQSEAFRRHVARWHPAFGDRVQELVFVGLDVDVQAFRSALEACLVSDDELEVADRWHTWPHPFPWPQAA